jgi:DNA processing protein
VDTCYPPENQPLFDAIAEHGLLVSESPLSAQIHARDFPRRNRIISGLSRGVVVVEAEARSGSLITARMAGEQGRDVMAVPGSPLDPRAAGANGLIRDGARLVTSAADVLETLALIGRLREPPRLPAAPGQPIDPPADLREKVAALLSPVPMTLDDLARESGLPWRTLAAIIVELELAGRAEMHHGTKVAARLG